MADDPLKIHPKDSAYVKQQKREAEDERDDILRSFRTLKFTVKQTKMKRYFELTCKHGKYVFMLDATLQRRRHWQDDFARARREHVRICGKNAER